MEILSVIFIILSLVWLTIGIKEAYKIDKEQGGFYPEQVFGLLIFFILPSVTGLACGIVGFILN